ncbi:hypothetical protein FOTG_19194 [Fusarium oxysporum f. sp. vasinfectum 25433]|uniref:Uncharacterized protein n=1 Tax=Fusarium oxysporum f. sp. vasinfectum 25433 TaxID=1089449 RepID=X0LUY2_FUSOX|nr:hypothetical protein FOTG_19194 [Fusarium oxysporum f. sp. vasinfectum 25433]
MARTRMLSRKRSSKDFTRQRRSMKSGGGEVLLENGITLLR